MWEGVESATRVPAEGQATGLGSAGGADRGLQYGTVLSHHRDPVCFNFSLWNHFTPPGKLAMWLNCDHWEVKGSLLKSQQAHPSFLLFFFWLHGHNGWAQAAVLDHEVMDWGRWDIGTEGAWVPDNRGLTRTVLGSLSQGFLLLQEKNKFLYYLSLILWGVLVAYILRKELGKPIWCQEDPASKVHLRWNQNVPYSTRHQGHL